LNIALKESNETEYWLELLHETDYIDDTQYNSMIQDNNNLTGILINIIKKTKENL
ncbi:MAG: four helix bundle protein, partial [Prevotella sp.]|nr:four helix bundle protein [Prevotella sp.]